MQSEVPKQRILKVERAEVPKRRIMKVERVDRAN